MSALRASLPPAPPPSTSIAWVTVPALVAEIVTLPLLALGALGVSLNSVSFTAMAFPLAAGVAVVAGGGAAAAELVDLLDELLLLLPHPTATSATTGARARMANLRMRRKPPVGRVPRTPRRPRCRNPSWAPEIAFRALRVPQERRDVDLVLGDLQRGALAVVERYVTVA